MVRTRFAPSPTGYLHIGGARTALFSWAYARKHGGKFILRIEDTDRERSTQASTQAILDAMQWLNLDYDEGPFYQMQRLDRYGEIAQDLIRNGKAYYCYASKDELEIMREEQRARGDKPRYNGRWRPENAKGKTPPSGVTPVIRFRNPLDGEVVMDDKVKGPVIDPEHRTRRPGDLPLRRRADLQLRRGRRRPRHGDHRRHARRRPRQQHAAADQHLSGRSGRRCRSSRTCR